MDRYFYQAARGRCGALRGAAAHRPLGFQPPGDFIPVIESSSIAIVTAYPGASAETVQGFVTEPIERVASSVPGLDYVESLTTAGTSTVTLWLRLNQDTTKVLAELSTRLSQIRFELPEGTEDPSIEISRADTPYASFYLGVLIPPTRTYAEVSDIIQRDILPRLSALPNVQRAMNYGLPQAMRIWLDPWRMAALSVDADDIYRTLQRNNVIGTFGQAESGSQRINLQTNSEAKTPEDFANMLIRREGSTEVRLGDVATVERGTMEVRAWRATTTIRSFSFPCTPSRAPAKFWSATLSTRPSHTIETLPRPRTHHPLR